MTEKELIEHALRRHQNFLKLNSKITSDYIQAHRLDVSQLRSLIIQISTIAFGIVGFSFPLFNNSNIVKTEILYILGMTLIAFCAIYGLWYINVVLQKSIIISQEGWRKNKAEVGEAIEAELFLIKNPDKFVEYQSRLVLLEERLKGEQPPKMQSDKFLHLLMALLTFGVFFLFLSIFKVSIEI
ncbi:hypothetical protein HYU90_00420 [Candidatus Collierbacteria bacterium]|nr:hypothetical protein [Candidatus Collierbacteria bacterium]